MKISRTVDHWDVTAQNKEEENFLTNITRRLVEDKEGRIDDVYSLSLQYIIVPWNKGFTAYDRMFRVLAGDGGIENDQQEE